MKSHAALRIRRVRRCCCRTQREVRLRVPAASSLRVDRRRVLNGQAVRFSGKVRSVPFLQSGKLVELQVRLSDRWQTFRTRRTDAAGRWSVPYRFRRTVGVQRYRFRLRLPPEAALSLYSRHLTVHCCPRQGAVMRSPRNSRHRAGSSDPSTRAKGDRVLDKLRRRLTYANVMSTVAVFIALGGSSYAALDGSPAATSRTARLPGRSSSATRSPVSRSENRVCRGYHARERGSPQRRYRSEPSGPVPQATHSRRPMCASNALRDARLRTGQRCSNARSSARRLARPSPADAR